jgi:hypothetical protein
MKMKVHEVLEIAEKTFGLALRGAYNRDMEDEVDCPDTYHDMIEHLYMSCGGFFKSVEAIFLNKNGYDHELEKFRKLYSELDEPKLYVECVYINNWRSELKFEGINGTFNSVMFEPPPRTHWFDDVAR